MTIRECVPIEQRCGNMTFIPAFETLKSHRIIKAPAGSFTITNTSDHCTMNVKIDTFKERCNTVQIPAGSSFTAVVSDLRNIEIACFGNSNNICTGTINFDLVYVIKL
ncbi:S-Ena type endospore appendage [Paenibacillus yanchengensis]